MNAEQGLARPLPGVRQDDRLNQWPRGKSGRPHTRTHTRPDALSTRAVVVSGPVKPVSAVGGSVSIFAGGEKAYEDLSWVDNG